jgi:hypothetical protein
MFSPGMASSSTLTGLSVPGTAASVLYILAPTTSLNIYQAMSFKGLFAEGLILQYAAAH